MNAAQSNIEQYADFTLGVRIGVATPPYPYGRPATDTLIHHQRMISKQHDEASLFLYRGFTPFCFYANTDTTKKDLRDASLSQAKTRKQQELNQNAHQGTEKDDLSNSVNKARTSLSS